MSEMFYFCSPHKQLPQRQQQVKYRALCRDGRCKIGGRRLKLSSSTMEVLSQRACMARFSEPSFYPSSVLPFTASTSSSRWTSGTVFGLEVSDDEDESGGVPLPADLTDQEMTDVPSKSFTSDEISGDQCSGVHHILCEVHSHGEEVLSRMPRSRPHSPNISLEEESRRIRMALGADDDDLETSPNGSDVEIPVRGGLQRFEIEDGASDDHPRTDSDPLELFGLPSTNINTLDIPEGESLLPELTRIRQRTSIPAIDPEALAVDHPWRNYDVTEFRETWRTESMFDASLPLVSCDASPLMNGWEQPTSLSRKDLSGASLDIQGLNWPSLGSTREDALQARELMHPSKHVQLTRLSTKEPNMEAEHLYRFNRFHSKHRATFSHYQLRNVLASSSRNDIFYATGNRVIQTSLSVPGLSTTVLDLAKGSSTAAPFRVTCLATSTSSPFSNYQTDNVLFAGGFYGEYALLDLNSQSSSNKPQHIEGFVTHSYNGLVTHIDAFAHRRSGLAQAAFCSNDHRVRILDVSTLRFSSEFTYSSSLNCSAISNDGRLRTLMGDSCETLITDADRGGVLTTLNGHRDHGFACAWAKDGIHMATAAQDGRTLIWDARNWSNPVKDLAVRMSCPRSLRWTGDNCLVVAEEDDVVHIYGGKSWEKRQEVRFFGAVAGVSVLDDGEEVVIANADRGVGGLLVFGRAGHGISSSGMVEMNGRERRMMRARRERDVMASTAAMNMIV